MKKSLLFLLVFAAFPFLVSAQNSEAVLQAEEAKEPVYEMYTVQKPPVFSGGQQELMKYLFQNVKIPDEAKECSSRRLVVGFTVQRDGTIKDVAALRDNCKILNEENKRVFEGMPAWQPGVKDGLVVAVHYILPMVLSLE